MDDIWKKFTDFLSWIARLPKKLGDYIRNAFDQFVKGLQSKLGPIYDAIKRIMDLFPLSPAKEGPFKDLDKVGIGFATELEKGFSVGMGGLYDTVLEGVGKIRDSLGGELSMTFGSPEIGLATFPTPTVPTPGAGAGEGDIIITIGDVHITGDIHAGTKAEAREIGEELGDTVIQKVRNGLRNELLGKGVPIYVRR